MNINGVGSYHAQNYAVQKHRAGQGSSVSDFDFMGNATSPSESSGNGKAIGLTTVGNRGYIAMYADSSTEQEPIIKVGDYEVRINDVNPRNATKMEMFALMSYMDDKGLTNNQGMKSFNKMTAYSSQAEYNGFCSGIYDENTAWTMKRDWIGILGNAKSTFFGNSQTYKQGLECEKMIENLKKWSESSYASGVESENADYQKILSERRSEIYEKLKNGDTEESFQIGGSSFTEKEWDKLLSEVDDITEEMHEAMREEHKKRFAKSLEEKPVNQTESVDNTDVISKLFDTGSSEIEVSNFKEYETTNYKVVPCNDGIYSCFNIYKNGESAGAYFYSDICIKRDSITGTEVLLSEHGTGAGMYNVIPMDEELKQALKGAMGVDELPVEELTGYSIKTHQGTGIQYVVKNGAEGRGGTPLLRSQRDIEKYNELIQTYMDKYPNLVTSQGMAEMYASFEICGCMHRTETGIMKVFRGSISYNDNYDFKNNWAAKFDDATWDLLYEWLEEHQNEVDDFDKFQSWSDILDEISGTYERIWSDEELKQGYLNN